MIVIRNAAELVRVAGHSNPSLHGEQCSELAIIRDGAVVIENGTISWVGPTDALPPAPAETTILDAAGKCVLPGFVDSHTHLLFAGSRADEFEQRLRGLTYQEISGRGGGINATVRRVRESTRRQLVDLARPRLQRFLQFGVTTVEVKSGYGLSLADELKCLEAIADLNSEGPVELVPTFLGAHAVPPEFASDRAAYLTLVRDQMLPEVVRCRLAEFCDVFCETGVFSVEESDALLREAKRLGLGLKVHADELSNLGGAELAARLGAISADHLLCISDRGIDALAESGTIATLLPGTAMFLGMPYAPARKLLERGAIVNLASDCNPGTCPTENLPLIGTLACTQMKMLPSEVIAGVTL